MTNDDDLVTCEDCGKTGIPARIEDIDCPHYARTVNTYSGP